MTSEIISIFLIAMATGFFMCIPVGPLNLMAISLRLKKKEQQALSLAIGGSLMDSIYAFLIATGLSFFSLKNFSQKLFEGIGGDWIKLAAVSLIFFLGVKEFFSKLPSEKTDEISSKLSLQSTPYIILGMMVYGTNPTLLLTMTAIITFLKSLLSLPSDSDWILNVPLSLGIGIGSFLWFFLLIKLVGKWETSLRKNFSLLTKISGVFLILLSLIMAYKIKF